MLEPCDAARREESDNVPRVRCWVCGTTILLDADRISEGKDYPTMPCTGCSALVPITRTDALRAAQEQLRARLARAQPPAPSFLERWRRPR